VLQVIFDTGSFMLAVFAAPAPEGMKPILEAETRVFEASEGWRGAAGELMWRLQSVDRRYSIYLLYWYDSTNTVWRDGGGLRVG
jgi:hypothetical protein